jgi:hypothetical protein
LIAVAVVALLLSLSGCGGSDSTVDSPPVRGAAGVVEALQSGPLDFKVFVDDSESRSSTPLIAQSMTDVGNAFELTLAAGGSFSAKAIRGDLASTDLVEPVLVPSPGGGGDEIERSEKATQTRSEIEAAEKALVAAHKNHAAIPGLRGGSALADNLHQALASTDPASGRHTVILVITDGFDDSLKGHLGESPKRLAMRLSKHLGPAKKGNAAVTVLIAGVGASSGGDSGATAYGLLSAWKTACERTGAHCDVSTEVEDPVLLEAFGDA